MEVVVIWIYFEYSTNKQDMLTDLMWNEKKRGEIKIDFKIFGLGNRKN